MLPSVRSRLPSGRCAADIVAASSRQYEAPVMPHNVITSVATPGSASIQALPALKPGRPVAAGSPPAVSSARLLGALEAPPSLVARSCVARSSVQAAPRPGGSLMRLTAPRRAGCWARSQRGAFRSGPRRSLGRRPHSLGVEGLSTAPSTGSGCAYRAQGLPQRPHGGKHGRRLVTAVRHAVRAPRVLAAPVGVPVGGLDQLLVGLGVPVGHQVARPLPAEQRVGRDAPRGAGEVLLALEEVEEQRRVVEP